MMKLTIQLPALPIIFMLFIVTACSRTMHVNAGKINTKNIFTVNKAVQERMHGGVDLSGDDCSVPAK